MAVTPLAECRPHAAQLSQYVLSCPVCTGVGAAHVDWSSSGGTLVRFVCGRGCAVVAADVLAAIPAEPALTGEPAA
jgi:hypothetical protein